MGLAAFKAQAAELTAPPLVTPKDLKNTIQKLAAAPLSTASKLQSFASNDPIQTEYEDDMSPNTNSKNVLMIRTNKIVHKRVETTEERENEERATNPGGLTDEELNRQITFAYIDLYEEPAAFEESPYVIMTAAGYNARESVTGYDGKTYTNVYDDEGNFAYADGNNMCYINKDGPASTIQSAQNAPEFDSIQQGTIKYKLGADGQLVERTKEDAAVQTAFARVDNQYTKFQSIDDIVKDVTRQPAQNDPSFLSATASGITTPVTPTEPFKAAASGTETATPTKSIMFTKNPMPWDMTKPAAPALTPEPAFN